MLHVEHVSRLEQVDVGAGADHSRDRFEGSCDDRSTDLSWALGCIFGINLCRKGGFLAEEFSQADFYDFSFNQHWLQEASFGPHLFGKAYLF